MLSRTTAVRCTAAFAALVFVASCAETATDSITGPSQAALNASADGDHGHVAIPRGQLERLNAAAARRGGGTGISYHGGPVLQAGTKVAAVYWASSPIFVNGPAAGTSGAGS